MKNKKSSISGIDANIIVLACYLLTLLLSWFNEIRYLAWLFPMIIYIIERKSEFVKKHSAQATILFGLYAIFSLIYTIVFIILFPEVNVFNVDLSNFAGYLLLLSSLSAFSIAILVVVTILSVIAVSKTWHYEEYNIPLINKLVPKFRNLMDKIMQNNNSKSKDIIIDTEIDDKELKRKKRKEVNK